MKIAEKEEPRGRFHGALRKSGNNSFSIRQERNFCKFLVPPLTDFFPHFKRVSRTELHGPCWRCGGQDRFIIFDDSGRGWCRQCEWHGDSIQLLRDRDGLSFHEALQHLGVGLADRPARKKARVLNFALAKAKQEFKDWEREQLVHLADRFRDLSEEKDVTEIAYRFCHRRPHLFSHQTIGFWTRRLAGIYDRLAILEHDLDLLTYNDHEAERFLIWQEVANG